jgi:flagellar biosynthesis protein FlhB
MAEETEKEQRQFDPTPRRLDRAREEGQVAQSRDFAGAVQLVLGLACMTAMAPALLSGMGELVRLTTERASAASKGHFGIFDALALGLEHVGYLTLGFCVFCSFAMTLPLWGQTGFNIASNAFRLRWDALNYFQKAGQVLNPKKLTVNLLLSIAKVGVAAIAIWAVLAGEMETIATLSLGTFRSVLERTGDILGALGLTASILLLAISGIDIFWQRRQHWESLKMTREELKQESQEQEGNPQFKSRRRKMHRELTMNQILDEVPKATVIVTNPTHLAVALRYRAGVDRSPVVTCKGADELAMHIRALARKHGIPVIEHKPLARVLWQRVKVGQRVPSNLYQVVAEVLAKVYRSQRKPSVRERG